MIPAAGTPSGKAGTDTCVKPGTGQGECGAGIPAGAKLAFNLIYNTTPPTPSLVEDLASNAKAAGIEIALSGSNFNFIIQNYNDAASPANENKWAMMDFGGETDSTYPTQFGFLNTGVSGQLGDYSDPQADALINASTSGTTRPRSARRRRSSRRRYRCCGSRCATASGPGRRTSRRPTRKRSRT